MMRQDNRRNMASYLTMLVLWMVNLLNYMDRYTVPGVLDLIQEYFGISNKSAGFISTVFICSYMVLAPVFGFLGDRYSRRALMAFGITLWSMVTLCSSFVGRSHWWIFLMTRALVGVGEASYSCVAPSVIADLYHGTLRSKMLAFYYLAIPFGSGLGFITGSKIALLTGDWRWALRVTPAFGILCVLILLLLVKEPQRGYSEGATMTEKTTYRDDLRWLFRNKTYVTTTLSFTAVAFVIGAMTWWSPNFMKLAYSILKMDESKVSSIFGAVTCLGGVCGVVTGSTISSRLKKRTLRADPLVCGFAVLGSIPFLFVAIYTANLKPVLSWIVCLVATTLLCFTWSLIVDIILFVVVPSRRATAEAVQILVSHAFGDAGSPYLIGLVADHVTKDATDIEKFRAMQIGLYGNAFVAILAAIGFLATSFFIVNDRRIAEVYMKVNSDDKKDDDADFAVPITGQT